MNGAPFSKLKSGLSRAEFSTSSWRKDAAAIVEELFQAANPDCWDALIDLRGELLEGKNCARLLDVFLWCRARMEEDHYLPFFRLRRLIAGSLRLEVEFGRGDARIQCLASVLRRKHPSVSSIRRALGREWFEHSLHVDAAEDVRLRLAEA